MFVLFLRRKCEGFNTAYVRYLGSIGFSFFTFRLVCREYWKKISHLQQREYPTLSTPWNPVISSNAVINKIKQEFPRSSGLHIKPAHSSRCLFRSFFHLLYKSRRTHLPEPDVFNIRNFDIAQRRVPSPQTTGRIRNERTIKWQHEREHVPSIVRL